MDAGQKAAEARAKLVEMEDDRAFLEQAAMSAPPMPDVAFQAYLGCLRTNEPEWMDLPWNDGALKRFAEQEKRWRWIFADAMLAERKRRDGR